MIRRTLVVSVVAIAVLSGCKRYTYTVNLKPVAAGLERSLTATSGTAQPGRGSPAAPVMTTISGVFGGTMPAEVGGAGTYTTYPTSLGTLHVYIERFRGDDDLAGQWERQQRAIDAAVDLLLTWINEKLANEQGVDKLRSFVDQEFRRDLKNAALYARIALEQVRPLPDEHLDNDGAGHRSERALAEFCARLSQYAVERGYFSPAQVPELMRAFESSDDGGRALMTLVRRQILHRMGRDEGDASFTPAALMDFASWKAAFVAHKTESPAATKRLAAWAAAAEPGLEQQDQDEQLQHLGTTAVRVPLMFPYDELALGLACPERPFATNGAWDDAAKRVTWAGVMETEQKDADGLPLLAYAAWSLPSVEVQTRLFGSVALRDEHLASYCIWRRGLSKPESEQWEDSLNRASPGPDLKDQLASFRLSGHEADEQPPAGIRAIIEGISRAD